MRKLIFCLFAAIFTVAIMSGVVQAQSSWIDDGVAPGDANYDDVTMSSEYRSTTLGLIKNLETGDLGTNADAVKYQNGGTTNDIFYEPSLDLETGWQVEFTLTNGTFEDANYTLLIDETALVSDLDCDNDGTNLSVGAEVGLAIDGGKDSSTVKFLIVNCQVPANAVLELSGSNDSTRIAPTIDITGTSGNTTIAVTSVATGFAVPINPARTPAVDLFSFGTQFTFGVSQSASSTIDTSAPSLRTNFLAEAGSNPNTTGTGDTILTESYADFLFTDNSALLDDAITLGAGTDTLELVITSTRQFTGVTRIGMNIDELTGNDADEAFTIGAGSTATSTLTLLTAAPQGDIKVLNVLSPGVTTVRGIVTVDDATALNTRTLSVQATMSLGDIPQEAATGLLLTEAAAWVWDINGYQGLLPWIDTKDTVPTFCLVSNTGNVDAEILLDVRSFTANTAGAIPNSLQNIGLGTVLRNSSVQLKWVGENVTFDPNGAGEAVIVISPAGVGVRTRYSGLMVVTAAVEDVFVGCFQTDPGTGSKRPLLVLTPEQVIDAGDSAPSAWK